MFFLNVSKIIVLVLGVVTLSYTPETITPYVSLMITCYLLYIQARNQEGLIAKQTDALTEMGKKLDGGALISHTQSVISPEMQAMYTELVEIINTEIESNTHQQAEAIQKQTAILAEMARNFEISIEAHTRQQIDANEKQTKILAEIAQSLNGVDQAIGLLKINVESIYDKVQCRNSLSSTSSGSSSSGSGRAYTGTLLPIWNAFKDLVDEKRKLQKRSFTKIFYDIEWEIEQMGGKVGSYTLQNFYKCNTADQGTKVVEVIKMWIESEGGVINDNSSEGSETKE